MENRDENTDAAAAKPGSETHTDQAVENGDAMPIDTAVDVSDEPSASDGELTRDNGEENGDNNDDDKSEEDDDLKPVPFLHLYRFATKGDIALLVFGIIGAIGQGIAWPIFALLFGRAVSSFATDNAPNIVGDMEELALNYVYLGVGVGFGALIRVFCFTIVGNNQAMRIRRAYLQSVVSQDMAWHDANPSPSVAARVSQNLPRVQESLGTKLGECVQYFSQGVAGMVIAFVNGWLLSLVVLAVSPILILSAVFVSKVVIALTRAETKAYEAAAVIASEALTLINTVKSLCSEPFEIERYNREAEKVSKAGARWGHVAGIGYGAPYAAMFILYAVAITYGSQLVRDGDDDYEAGDVLTVLIALIIGAMGLGASLPHIAVLLSARTSARPVYDVIDRESPIDALSSQGSTPSLQGDIEFRDVVFRYPSRPKEPVLQRLSFCVKKGQTVALVGASGSGKSTTVSIVERFYKPDEGEVFINGIDIEDINPAFLRSRIGLVEQMPTLFSGSIYYNISLGNPDASEQEIIAAAKRAHAHEFISKLSDGYHSEVGSLGSQLSGGQRQRIVIARALVANPDILLLDEATSALDNKSERIVQQAIDEVSKDVTTLVVAHRLSTIRRADVILVMDKGRVVEQGTHTSLMRARGNYFALVMEQEKLSHEDYDEGVEADEVELAKESRPSVDADVNEDDIKALKRASEATKQGDEAAAEDEKRTLDTKGITGWAWQQSRPDRPTIIGALVFALLGACVWPVFSFLLAQAMDTMLQENHSAKDISYWAIGFACLAGANLVFTYARFVLSIRAGERLTLRLRQTVFAKLMYQSCEWYDQKQNKKERLMDLLASDIPVVHNLLATRWSVMILTAGTILIGVVVALSLCWRIALVVLACIPLVALSGMAHHYSMTRTARMLKELMKDSEEKADEIIHNIRSVVALDAVRFYSHYSGALETPTRRIWKYAPAAGVLFGITQLVNMIAYALAFWYGGIVVDEGFCSFEDMFGALSEILFCAIMAGVLAAQGPNAAQAGQAAASVRALFDKLEEPKDESGLEEPPVEGDITFNDVVFGYPTRERDKPVLDGFNLVVAENKTTALVGSSGAGKSTTISLLERFYEPKSGEITVGGKNIAEMPTRHVRRHMALVMQQPHLFSGTIAENIAYGTGSVKHLGMDRIRHAARLANADDFIMDFKDGYETVVGKFGSQLSGGQRQRIAIARAIVRQQEVKILLLDEATSALDSKSEQLVQDALEAARQGRTTIIIAHRLSTVQSADSIAVVDSGKVVEQGSHEELMEAEGAYYNLVAHQQLVPTAARNTSAKARQQGPQQGRKLQAESEPEPATDVDEKLPSYAESIV